MKRKVYVVAGELSGDVHGEELMAALQKRWPQVEFRGWGGAAMRGCGGEGVRDWVADAAVMGIVEVLKHYSWFKKKFDQTIAEVVAWQPDVLLLIDYPGFNLRLAKALKARGLATKVVHYVAPQVWAWNRGRVPKVAASHDLLLCLFPFEKDIFEEFGLKTVCVGHPLVDELEELRISATRESRLVGLFPGSREREVARLFPIMLESVQILLQKVPGVHFESAAASAGLAKTMQKMRVEAGLSETQLKITIGGSQALMQRAECAVLASGTATLEAGFYGLPYCLIYAVSWGTFLASRVLLKIKHLGLINILAKREVVPEFLQDEANAYEISFFLHGLLENPAVRAKMTAELLEVAATLGDSGVHERGAQAIADLFSDNSE